MFQPFWDTYRAVTERYAGGDVDRKAIVEGAIKGMIGALDDPYSQYLTSEEFKASLQGISGEFEGIGATIGTVDAGATSSSCTDLGRGLPDGRSWPRIKDAPADKAGLLPGDVITHIDGVAVDGQTLDEARMKVRGPKGTPVVLTIERDGEAPRDIEVVRAVIVIARGRVQGPGRRVRGLHPAVRLLGSRGRAVRRGRRGGRRGRAARS